MQNQSLILLQLQSCNDLSDLASLLNLKPATLSFIIYKIPRDQRYHYFSVAKKGGGSRSIMAPTSRLKMIQRRLADLLSDIQEDQERSRAKEQCIIAHGFKKKLSITTNAKNHRNKRYVFNADLEDFFPSITFGRIRGFLTNSKALNLKPSVATVIAQIACHAGILPQGSPCSPVLSNLLCHILDMNLNRLAKRWRCTYTRYVDDLTFSTNEMIFPEPIAEFSSSRPHQWVAGNDLLANIYKSGFKLNNKKVHMQYCSSRQIATGLIVNKKINVRVEYYKQARAMCDRLFVGGTPYENKPGLVVAVPNAKLRGMLSHIYHVRSIGSDGKQIEKKNRPAYFRLYRQFLDFVGLYDAGKPVIVCEGKTDVIYIRAAIEAMASKFPDLVQSNSGKFNHALSFFKYTKHTAQVQDLSGGTGQLNKLVTDYKNRVIAFRKRSRNPLILVTDFDTGSADLFKFVAKIVGKTVGGLDPFYHIYNNLYLVPIPKVKSPMTAIEDLFEKSVLDTKLDGKSFDRTNKEEDGSKFYGKYAFATKVVLPSKNTINFTNFEKVLISIRDVRSHYLALAS